DFHSLAGGLSRLSNSQKLTTSSKIPIGESLDHDDELAARVAFLEVAQRFRGFAHWVSLLHQRLQLARRHQLAQEIQIRLVSPGYVARKFPIRKSRPERRD